MSLETYLSLIIFLFAISGTPGPNVIMCLSSGITFGFRRTIPHILGIGIGLSILLTAVGLGFTSHHRALPHYYSR